MLTETGRRFTAASFVGVGKAGDVEKEIAKLFEAGKDEAAYLKLYDFLLTIQTPTTRRPVRTTAFISASSNRSWAKSEYRFCSSKR